MKYWIFIAIALFATLQLFQKPGYLLLLDWQGVPNVPWAHINETNGIAGTPVVTLWHILGLFFGSAIAQKLLITLVLACAGCSTAKLAHDLTQKQFPAVAAGIFAMSNPFVISRLAMGHIYLLFAYALTPLALFFTLRFLQKPSVRKGVFAGIVNALVLFCSIHFIILLPIALIVFIVNSRNLKKISWRSVLALIIPIAVTSLIILSTTLSNPSSALPGLTWDDLALFAPQAQCSTSVLADSVILSSSWRSPMIAPMPCKTSLAFAVASVALLIPMAMGARRKKLLGIAAIAFVILASVPLLPAMRDSGKFLAVLAIIESILLAYGLKNRYWNIIVSICVGISVCALVVQLHKDMPPHEYPTSWYEWNTSLATLPEQPVVLFLPWHLYMPFNFTNGATIGNPAQQFFTRATIIQGDNLEIRQGTLFASSHSNRPISREIESVLSSRNSPMFVQLFENFLRDHHIDYIALAHGSTEQAIYEKLFESLSYMHIEYSKPGLTVWQFVQ